MRVEFDPSDLRLTYQRKEGDRIVQAIETKDVTIGHLNKPAQDVVLIAGRGMFHSFDRTSYREILPSYELARYSSLNGRGIVWIRDKVYVIDVEKMYAPEEAGNTNLNMWLPQEGIAESIPEEFPFKSIYDEMKVAVDQVFQEVLHRNNLD